MTWSLDTFYDAYPAIEEEFSAALDQSLQPRNSGMLFDLVAGLGLPPGAVALDVGCGEGEEALHLAERFGFSVTGIDPVPRHIEIAQAQARGKAGFVLGTAEAIPAEPGSADLVWCRDVLVHVADLAGACAEFRRVLRPGGRAVVYLMSGTDLLEPREAAWLWSTMGVVPASADAAHVEAAITGAGLRIDEHILVGSEWSEWSQENRDHGGRKLLHASRLLRTWDSFAGRYGEDACDIMLGDCLWQIYAMIGKLARHVYVLS